MREFVKAPNLVTSGSLVAGFLALILAVQGEFAWAAGLVGVAAAFDLADGIVARRTEEQGAFGSRLDGLADLVSFGAAPALMLYLGPLHSLPVVGIGSCLGFLVSGAWRLARFPLVASTHHFVGLPIPPAGVIAAVMVALGPPPGGALAATLALTVLMVSAVRFPTLSSARRLRRTAGYGDSPEP